MAGIDSDFYNDLIKIAEEFLRATAKELDQYTTRKNEVIVESNQIVLLTPSHIHFAKYGRGPGKKPPLDPILQWVKKKGIVFSGLSEQGTAFAIQAKIARDGTSNFVSGAPNALEEALEKNLQDYNYRVGNLISYKINQEVNKIYKEVFPETVEFKI